MRTSAKLVERVRAWAKAKGTVDVAKQNHTDMKEAREAQQRHRGMSTGASTRALIRATDELSDAQAALGDAEVMLISALAQFEKSQEI